MAFSVSEVPLSLSLSHTVPRNVHSHLLCPAQAHTCSSQVPQSRRILHTQFLNKWAPNPMPRNISQLRRSSRSRRAIVVSGLEDFIGGDLIGFDLGKWVEDVEKHGAIAMYVPPEGGYEGRYATRLKALGYHFLNMTARGLGDPEAYLSKVHGVRPPHLGKQAIARWYLPPEVDYRLSLLPPNSKGVVLWLIEAQVLSKSELQYLALLPILQPRVKVIAECGSWRKVRWKPLKEVAGLPVTADTVV